MDDAAVIESAARSAAQLAPAARSPAAGHDLLVTVIQPRSGWRAVYLRELWRYHELLWLLIWRDVKVRYKQTVLGAAWAILQPTFSMVLFTIIFGRFAKIPSEGAPYPVFVYAGLLPWMFLSNAVAQSGVSMVNQPEFLTKIYFPRLFMPLSSIGAGLVDFTLSFGVFIVLMMIYRYAPGPGVVMLPVLLLLTIMTAAGMGILLAGLTVTYRDFRFVVPFLLQVWMYASPVIYPLTMFPPRYRWVMALNPMGGIITGFRSALLHKPFDWTSLAISATVATGLFLFAVFHFRRTERFFADIA